MKHKLKQFLDPSMIRFFLVGIANTLVGTTLMFGLYNLAHWSYWLSSATNYTITSIMSYFLNKYFTFQNKDKHNIKQIIKYIITIAVCYGTAYGIAKPLCKQLLIKTTNITIRENISLFVGMILFTCLNYIGQKYFAFKTNNKTT